MTDRSRPSSVRIRRGRPGDLGALMALEAHFPSDRLSARSLRRFLAAPRTPVLVAVGAGADLAAGPDRSCVGGAQQLQHSQAAAGTQVIIGNLVLLLRAGSRKARVYSLVVSPSARGRGVGDSLVQAAEQAARHAGCVQIGLEVRADNTAALALYQRRGYTRVRGLPGYYDDGADGIGLARRLDARC